VDSEPAGQVAFEPVTGHGVVDRGDVYQQVTPKAEALGAVEHHLEPDVVRRRPLRCAAAVLAGRRQMVPWVVHASVSNLIVVE
jgi:hypothetical protein